MRHERLRRGVAAVLLDDWRTHGPAIGSAAARMVEMRLIFRRILDSTQHCEGRDIIRIHTWSAERSKGASTIGQQGSWNALMPSNVDSLAIPIQLTQALPPIRVDRQEVEVFVVRSARGKVNDIRGVSQIVLHRERTQGRHAELKLIAHWFMSRTHILNVDSMLVLDKQYWTRHLVQPSTY